MGSSVTNKLVRPRTNCSGLEEGEDAMTDEEGEEAGTADGRVRAQEKGKHMKQHTCRSAIGAHTARWAEVALITTCRRKGVRTCRGDS